jgi:hypothetical protein
MVIKASLTASCTYLRGHKAPYPKRERETFLFSTCFGRLCAHHQEKQLYSCDTWYLLLCMDECLVCRVEGNGFIYKMRALSNFCGQKCATFNFVINYEYNQRDATIHVNLLFLVSSTCVGRRFRHSPRALDCIYIIW